MLPWHFALDPSLGGDPERNTETMRAMIPDALPSHRPTTPLCPACVCVYVPTSDSRTSAPNDLAKTELDLLWGAPRVLPLSSLSPTQGSLRNKPARVAFPLEIGPWAPFFLFFLLEKTWQMRPAISACPLRTRAGFSLGPIRNIVAAIRRTCPTRGVSTPDRVISKSPDIVESATSTLRTLIWRASSSAPLLLVAVLTMRLESIAAQRCWQDDPPPHRQISLRNPQLRIWVRTLGPLIPDPVFCSVSQAGHRLLACLGIELPPLISIPL